MIRKYGLPLLALFGIGFSLFMIYKGMQQPPVAPILFPPPTSPYKHYAAGQGMIESYENNISIGVPFPNLVDSVHVHGGDIVPRGTPLFTLDQRQLTVAVEQAKEELEFEKTDYENKKIQFSFYERLQRQAAISEQEYQKVQYDMKLAHDRVIVAQANVARLQMRIERSIIRAPMDGEVLLVNVRPGDFANVNPFDTRPYIIFGDTSTYQMRVDVNEEDAWRIIKGAPATAYVRGNSKIQIPLEFNFIEPFMIPKRVLTGSTIERVDTRVLQIVYLFDKKDYQVFVGQLLDVYVEAQPNEITA